MIFQALVGPLATLWTLPPVLSLCCVLISGSIAGLSLGLKYVRAHEIGIPEVNMSVFSTSMVGVSLLLLFYINVINRWEDNFDAWPWKQQNSAKSKLYCPFTGSHVCKCHTECYSYLSTLSLCKKVSNSVAAVQVNRSPCAALVVRHLSAKQPSTKKIC